MGPKFWSRRLESNFLRDFNDWELDMVGDLIHVLRGHRPSLEKDSVFWKGGRNGQFKIKEVYSLLVNPNDTAFPSWCIWVDRLYIGEESLSLIGFLEWLAST